MRSIYLEPVVQWLRTAYRDELPHNFDHVLETPFIPNRSGNNTRGEWAGRLYDEKYLSWLHVGPECPEPRKCHDKDHWTAEEWLLAAHEAVKRLRNGGSRRGRLEHDWLLFVISWGGTPCLCDCAGPVEHLAMVFRTHPGHVRRRVLAAARRVASTVGKDRDPRSVAWSKPGSYTRSIGQRHKASA